MRSRCGTGPTIGGSLPRAERGRDFVTAAAYRPTGAALGCPLPDDGVSRKLSLVAEELERFLRRAHPDARSWFAFVPASSYHVTVVNRGHYDTSEIISLDTSMRRHLAGVVEKYPSITLDLAGIALTRQGRVLAKCIPRSNDLVILRQLIVSRIPELAENVPLRRTSSSVTCSCRSPRSKSRSWSGSQIVR